MTPRMSVTIPHLNQPDIFAYCLASLAAGWLQPDEIIVLESGSKTLPTAVCHDFPSVRLHKERALGPGTVRNCGVADLVAGAAPRMKVAFALVPARSSLSELSEVCGP